MTTIHTTRGRATGTCMHCGAEQPDHELAIYHSREDLSWWCTCEDCHAKARVLVQWWQLIRLSELRTGTAFPWWWKHRGVRLIYTTKE